MSVQIRASEIELDKGAVLNSQAPMLPAGPWGQVEANHCSIASVHYSEVVVRLRMNGIKHYVIPACTDRDKPTYLKVYDTFESIRDTTEGMDDSPTNSESDRKRSAPILCHGLRDSILEEATGGMIGDLQGHPPGIIAILGDTATSEEHKRMLKMEESYCTAMTREASRFHALNDPKKGSVHDGHRLAAKWLGDEDFVWFREIKQRRFKIGLASGNRIPAEAIFDGTVNLLELYLQLGIDPASLEGEQQDLACAKMLKTPSIRSAVVNSLKSKGLDVK